MPLGGSGANRCGEIVPLNRLGMVQAVQPLRRRGENLLSHKQTFSITFLENLQEAHASYHSVLFDTIDTIDILDYLQVSMLFRFLRMICGYSDHVKRCDSYYSHQK